MVDHHLTKNGLPRASFDLVRKSSVIFTLHCELRARCVLARACDDKGIPEVMPHECVFEDCQNCGHCPELKDNEDLKVCSRQWQKAPRRTKEGEKQRFQNEEMLLNKSTLQEALQKFGGDLGQCSGAALERGVGQHHQTS
jgi:hypothetical protein